MLIFILAGIGITSIITQSSIFEPLRSLLDNGKEQLYENFFGKLITCPQCVGFWVGVFINLFIFSPSFTLVIHDSSNFFSFLPPIFDNIFSIFLDGGVISLCSWVLLSFTTFIEKKYEYFDTMDLYYQQKAADEYQEKLNKARDEELFKD